MRFVNLTPHAIHLPNRIIEPSGALARCSEITVPMMIIEGVEIIGRSYGEVFGLPEQQDDTMYIVSLLVRQALPHRHDLLSPGDLIRDTEGQIKGAKNLVANLMFTQDTTDAA